MNANDLLPAVDSMCASNVAGHSKNGVVGPSIALMLADNAAGQRGRLS